jgi:hypothetical protein
MTEFAAFTPEQAQALWQDFLSRRQLDPALGQNGAQGRPPLLGFTIYNVVLDETLDAATNGITTPATATASVLYRNPDTNELFDSGVNIEIVNRYEHISLDQYTIGVAVMINGEWRLISADCAALGDWP